MCHALGRRAHGTYSMHITVLFTLTETIVTADAVAEMLHTVTRCFASYDRVRLHGFQRHIGILVSSCLSLVWRGYWKLRACEMAADKFGGW